MTSNDHYRVLGVAPDAPEHVIRAAYKAQMKVAHPDAGGDAEIAGRVNEAWDVLGNPESRAAYDRDQAAAAERERPCPAPQSRPEPEASPAKTGDSPTGREPTASPGVLAGGAPWPVRHWRRRPVSVSLAVAVVAVTVLVILTALMVPGEDVRLAARLVPFVAVVGVFVLYVLRRTLAGIAVLAGAVVLPIVFTIPDLGVGLPLFPAVCAAASAALVGVFGATLVHQRHREQVELGAYAGACVVATAQQDGVGAFYVDDITGWPDAVSLPGVPVWMRVRDLVTGEVMHRSVTGIVPPPGNVIAVTDRTGEVLVACEVAAWNVANERHRRH